MSLDIDTIVAYLLESGLVTTEAIVRGDLLVRSVPGKNRILRIERRRAMSYFLKQPGSVEHSGDRTLTAEAEFYRLCWGESAATRLTRYLPCLYHDDSEGRRLVFGLLAGARTLGQELDARTAGELSYEPWRALGEALATVHVLFRSGELAHHPFVTGLSDAKPWVRNLHRPVPKSLGRLSRAHRLVLRVLQTEEELSAKLEGLPPYCVETLIHNDVKSDNVMVLPDRKDGRPDVRLVDWETVRRGDPAWDVAGLFQDVLVQWIRHMPHDAELTPQERQARARYPIAVLQPAVRAFWHAYRRGAELEPAAAADLLRRAVPFSAARLVQSAYEHAGDLEHLSSASVLMLQIASNVLAHPARAAFHLYGLPAFVPS